MKKTFLPLATMVVASFILTACGGTSVSSSLESSQQSSSEPSSAESSESSSEEVVTPARPLAAFALGEKGEAGTFDAYRSYQVNLYKDDVYELISTQITYGYSMVLGTTVTVNYGTYVKGASEDGVTEYTLNKAAEVVLSSYSLAGGFKLQVNTADPDQTYPAELPAATQGEQIFAQNKEDVINAYGLGTKIYVGSNNVISFIDPNDDSEEPQKAVVETASGSVASVLNKAFKQVQVVSSTSPAAVGDLFAVKALHIFEDDSYEFISTGITYGYSMVLGTTNYIAYGEGAYRDGEDGYTPYDLALADDVVLNSYSLAGGFSFAINTADENQEYPTELPTATQGEQNFAQNKEDVINAYGPAFKVFTSDSDCVMSLEDPNAE